MIVTRNLYSLTSSNSIRSLVFHFRIMLGMNRLHGMVKAELKCTLIAIFQFMRWNATKFACSR
ncbi:unnamed protein product, partial [Cylicostephanus goldi]